MRIHVWLTLALALGLAPGCAGTASEATTSSGPTASAGATNCPATTEAENIAIARVWHEEAINGRNPAALHDILSPEVVHHAAGGYPDTMTSDEVVVMMGAFPAGFSDLHYDFDLLFAQDDLVVERYTASGTHDGPLQDLPASGRKATWTGINIFRIACGRIVEIWSEVDALSRRQQLTGAMPGS
ncbi:MAG: ester cyclase [Geminicoccaceae bacterium]